MAGFLYAFAWKDGEKLQEWCKIFLPTVKKTKTKTFPGDENISSEEINRILDKIGREGMASLTPAEKASLQKATRRS